MQTQSKHLITILVGGDGLKMKSPNMKFPFLPKIQEMEFPCCNWVLQEKVPYWTMWLGILQVKRPFLWESPLPIIMIIGIMAFWSVFCDIFVQRHEATYKQPVYKHIYKHIFELLSGQKVSAMPCIKHISSWLLCPGSGFRSGCLSEWIWCRYCPILG